MKYLYLGFRVYFSTGGVISICFLANMSCYILLKKDICAQVHQPGDS